MLRKTTASFFNRTHPARQICLKQCGSEQPKNENAAQLEHNVNSVGRTLMLALILNPPKVTNYLFPQIFKLPIDKMPTVIDILRQIEDFNTLITKLPKVKVNLLAQALSSDLTTLQKSIEHLSSDNQRRVLDFIGLEKIIEIGTKDSFLAKESKALAFFMISESLNHSLRRKNHDYLYTMQQREIAPISARPMMGES